MTKNIFVHVFPSLLTLIYSRYLTLKTVQRMLTERRARPRPDPTGRLAGNVETPEMSHSRNCRRSNSIKVVISTFRKTRGNRNMKGFYFIKTNEL